MNLERSTPSDANVDPDVLQRVDAFVEREIVEGAIPGAVVLATRGRRLFYERAFGDGTLGGRKQFFSFSKAIATTVACRAVADGALHWDDPVERWIPAYACKGKEGTLVRHLVTHAAGIPAPCPHLHDERDWDDALRELCETEAIFPPGTATAYHPISGHLLAGAACVAATGRSFNELSRPVLDEIGATETSFVTEPGLLAWQPGGGFAGPAEDILKVIHLHLDRPAWVDGMHTLQYDVSLPGYQAWGLGWVLGVASDRIPFAAWNGMGAHTRDDTFSHGGASSLLGAGDPSRDVAIAIAATGAPSDADGPSREASVRLKVTITNTTLEACA